MNIVILCFDLRFLCTVPFIQVHCCCFFLIFKAWPGLPVNPELVPQNSDFWSWKNLKPCSFRGLRPLDPRQGLCPWTPPGVKGPYADHILIPQGSTGSSIFFDIKWKPIFFWLQIQNFSFKFFVVLEIYKKMVKLIGIPENNFFCIFITASSPGVHTFFCFWRVNKKLPQGETSQNAFQRSRSIN